MRSERGSSGDFGFNFFNIFLAGYYMFCVGYVIEGILHCENSLRTLDVHFSFQIWLTLGV